MVELLPYRPLADWLLPPPLNALFAVGVLLGLFHVGKWLARRIQPAASALHRTAITYVWIGVLFAFVHALAWAGIALAPTLRAVGIALFVVGVLSLRTLALPQRVPPLSMLALACAALFVVGALGPPTDVDSLDYHLGVPLDWLNQGHARPRLDWLHARLVGLGEMAALLGLAVGTDCLSSLLQAAMVLALTHAIAEQAADDDGKTLARLLVATTPVLVFLALSQKPQVLPAAGTTLAFLLLTTGNPDRRAIMLAMLCATFAASCKYSMYVTSGVLVIFAALINVRHAFVGALVGGLLFNLPLMARTFAFYGDPLSPLLENLRPEPDLAVVQFAGFLKTVTGERSLRRVLMLLVECVVPTSPGGLSLTLGAGSLAWVTLVGKRVPRMHLGPVIVAFALSLLGGQLAARFLLEPYWWTAVLVVRHASGTLRKALTGLLALQSAVVLLAAAFGAVMVGSGALSSSLRDAAMTRHADSQALARVIDEKLPRDAIILVEQRPMAIWPRPALCTLDYGAYERGSVYQAIRKTLASVEKPAFLVHQAGSESPLMRVLQPCLGGVEHRAQVPMAMRNPFNPSSSSAVELIALRLDAPGCRARLAVKDPTLSDF